MAIELNVSPNWGQAFGALVAVLGGLGAATTQLTTLFGQGEAGKIVAGASLAALVLGPVVTVLFRGSSTTPGPWATPDPNPVPASAAPTPPKAQEK